FPTSSAGRCGAISGASRPSAECSAPAPRLYYRYANRLYRFAKLSQFTIETFWGFPEGRMSNLRVDGESRVLGQARNVVAHTERHNGVLFPVAQQHGLVHLCHHRVIVEMAGEQSKPHVGWDDHIVAQEEIKIFR